MTCAQWPPGPEIPVRNNPPEFSASPPPDGLEEKPGRHEAEEQPQEKAEGGAHGLIPPKPVANGKVGDWPHPALPFFLVPKLSLGT